MKKMVYIASPYSGDEQNRFEKVRDYVAQVMLKGEVIPFSPIVHCHDIAHVHNLPRTHNFWIEMGFGYLVRCDELWILTLPGWCASQGVKCETMFAHKHRIPVKYKGVDDVTE